MNTAILEEMTQRSLDGTVTFPEVVRALMEAGVESYGVDLTHNVKTHYMLQGKPHTESFAFQGPAIAPEFSEEKVVAALRSIQGGKINYQEFLNQIMKAGTSRYHVYLTGRKTLYFGRKGEVYTEHFPPINS